jgi:hypothetical protein
MSSDFCHYKVNVGDFEASAFLARLINKKLHDGANNAKQQICMILSKQQILLFYF